MPELRPRSTLSPTSRATWSVRGARATSSVVPGRATHLAVPGADYAAHANDAVAAIPMVETVQALRHDAQQLVTNVVAMFIVDLLEVIQIHEHHDHGQATAL